ncbi:helix-turn-helix transcriptional regulator [Actinokineospora auranticolor]|uniref:AraC-like DNA-binding protein n=1 Tax=Actinokineospora auranticolor TaxID=155976 RepID=A0A2S6GPC9_9PSEU|nr:helix-turn-helix transcriptional regulator [Actinokineospora auranticolor]PPK67057.1 AraC-like DNA-binding protein [Actinokineospora auranticolor]
MSLTGTAAPPRRTEFVTTEADQAHQHLVAAYDQGLRMSGLLGARALRHDRTDAGLFAVDDLELPMRLGFDADTFGLLIIECRAGRVERTMAGTEDRVGAGDVLVQTQPEMPFAARTEDAALRSVMFHPELFTQVAESAGNRLRFTGFQPVSAVAQRRWKDAVSYIADLVLPHPEYPLHPLVVANAGRLLAATALATFPNTALLDPSPGDRNDAGPATLHRAIAFIEDHAADDITVADIAAAARVTIRAVQLAFRRHRGTTPMAYLRRVRLECAHRDLRDADPGRETVSAVAARWGFFNAGRFTAYYREAFAALPSQTLRG